MQLVCSVSQRLLGHSTASLRLPAASYRIRSQVPKTNGLRTGEREADKHWAPLSGGEKVRGDRGEDG